MDIELAPRRFNSRSQGTDQAQPDYRLLLRRLRSKLWLSRRMNGRSWQRMTSISLKACRRNSIWASSTRIFRSATDGITK